MAERLLFVPDFGFSPRRCEDFPVLQTILSELRGRFAVEIFLWPTIKGGPKVPPTWRGTVDVLREAIDRFQPHHVFVMNQTELCMLALHGNTAVSSLTGAGMTGPPATLRAFGMDSLAEFYSAFYQWGKQRSYQFIQLVMPSTTDDQRRALADQMDSELDQEYLVTWLGSLQALNLVDERPQINIATLCVLDPAFEELSEILYRFAPDGRVERLEGFWALDNLDVGRELARIVTAFIGEVSEGTRLATVMVTDMVDSTARAIELGDQRWTELLAAHDATVRRELGRFGGREIDTRGDGFLATFESPSRAVKCGTTIIEAARILGLEIRIGIHSGELEPVGENVGADTMHVTARLVAKALPNEVLVSERLRQLLSGGDFQFEERGSFPLKGLPGDWRLFAVRSS